MRVDEVSKCCFVAIPVHRLNGAGNERGAGNRGGSCWPFPVQWPPFEGIGLSQHQHTRVKNRQAEPRGEARAKKFHCELMWIDVRSHRLYVSPTGICPDD